MSVKNYALFRYEVIDHCLRTKSIKCTRKRLKDILDRRIEAEYGGESDISISQVTNDLDTMRRHLRAPIDSYPEDGSNERVHYYTLPGWSIKDIPISDQELEELIDFTMIAKQKSAFAPFTIPLREIAKKLHRRYSPALAARKIISIQGAPSVSGVRHIRDMRDYIKAEKPISIIHQKFSDDQPREWTVHPYLLKEDDHRWYVFGYVPEVNELRKFGLERIHKVRPLDEPYIPSPLEDNEDYFRHIIGVTNPEDEEVQEIRLLFSPKMGRYIATRSLHASQECSKPLPDGSLPVSYNLKINPELIAKILSYGAEVKVLAPQRLIDEVKEAHVKATKLYE